jgi:fumarylacetoacetase
MTLIEQPFSLQHLPYGIVRFGRTPHLCVRLEDQAISLYVLAESGLLKGLDLGREVTLADNLNPLIALDRKTHSDLRSRLLQILGRSDHLHLRDVARSLAPYPTDDPKTLLPLAPTDFVDFYCSRHHAFRVGCLFRGPDNALPDQYFDLPIGYHGRCSTVFGSGTPVARPHGILKGDPKPRYAPTERLDYELEVGFVLRGHHGALKPDQAFDQIFGIVLVNDWSARDIQAFEYRPLGPFLGKSFATSVGNWVTPLEALESWQQSNTDSDHATLPHLSETNDHHFDIPLSAVLTTADGTEQTICNSNLKHLAWSAAQMVAHLSSNGTIISPGDLIATGTVSGPDSGAEACLLESTSGGKSAFEIGDETRTFLQDGDTITLLGGHLGFGLAPCRGLIKEPEVTV